MNKALIRSLVLTGTISLVSTSHGQLIWSSYDTSGNLINANEATGGEGASLVDLVVGAGQTVVFVTRNFVPLDLTVNGAISTVNFTFNASGGLTTAAAGTRVMGWGLYNTAGTASNLSDDAGFWTRFNYGNYPELFTHDSGGNIFSGTQQGQGGSYTGSPVDQTTYDALIRLRNNSGTGIALGSGSALGSAGVAIQGSGVDQRAYINAVTPPPGSYFTFNEFAFYFNNTSGSEVTVTLGNLNLTPASVPEPSVMAVGALGVLGLLVARRKWK